MDIQLPKVLVAAPAHEVLTLGLQQKGYQLIHQPNITQQTAYKYIDDCAGIITSTRLLIDRQLIDAAPALRWVGRMGSGMEIIDTVYAAQKGIYCFSSPEGNCNAVGEHAVGMLLSLLRKLRDSHLEVVNGIWKREENRGWELEGKTVGIVGFGHTGRSFARKLMGFGVNILAYDKYSLDDIPAYVTPTNDITELYSAADILSFHVPLNADTHHYFNERFLQRMKKPFILINTSRGKVVSLQAVAQGLTEGRITGVCLDVYEEEPPSKITGAVQEAWKVIHSNPHAVLTPHIAGYTWEALYKMAATLVEKAPGAASLQLS